MEEPWNGPLVAVGDPVYNTADSRWNPPAAGKDWRDWLRLLPGLSGAPKAPAAPLNRLAGSAREVRMCAKAYGGERPPVVLTGPSASFAALRSALAARPSVVHLATHVVPSPGGEPSGQIALSLSPNGSPELVGPAAVASLEARAGLVVMSGCSSGSGEVLPGEGLMGLTRAWLRAGVRDVAATLWPTTDSSGEMLRVFYDQLSRDELTRRAPEKALQLAQAEMLDSGTWRSRPVHWASFFVVSRK
jgi:CHAT domain-containing protein